MSLNGFKNGRGIDVSKEQVDLAKQHGSDAIVADVFEYLKDKVNSFDVIIALDFIEHFHKEELLNLVPAIYGALIDEGKLILQTPNAEGLFSGQNVYGDLTHLTIFTPKSIQQLFCSEGFINCKFIETGPVPKNVHGRIRIIIWSIIKYMASFAFKIETGKKKRMWTENMICYCEKRARDKQCSLLS